LPAEERKQRVEDLPEAGVATMVHSWHELAEVILGPLIQRCRG
jgi:hypothetical protein